MQTSDFLILTASFDEAIPISIIDNNTIVNGAINIKINEAKKATPKHRSKKRKTHLAFFGFSLTTFESGCITLNPLKLSNF